MQLRRALLKTLSIGLCWWAISTIAAEGEPPARSGRIIDFGVQPMGLPVAAFSEAIRRDRILRDQLARAGWTLQEHPFAKGSDIVSHLGPDALEAAILGDMPTLDALASHDVLAVALLKHSFSWVVTDRQGDLSDLKGKRIGNAFGSSAHYTLLEALASVGLTEGDVELVEMTVSDMPDALESGRIAAFCAWEPAPAIALRRNPKHAVAYRGTSDDFLVIERTLAEREPELTRQFIASVARAFHWMRQNREQLLEAANWSLDAGAEYSAKPPILAPEQAAEAILRDAVDVPGMPLLPHAGGALMDRMAGKLDFLKQVGKVAQSVSWDKTSHRFVPGLLEEILGEPARYRVYGFDYER